MNRDLILGFAYIIVFITTFIISFIMIADSNFSKFFKQGQVKYIRISYFIISIIVGFLFSSAIIRFVEAVYDIILS